MEPWTITSATMWAIQLLKENQFKEDTRLEAELLLADILGYERLQLYTHFDQQLTLEQQKNYQSQIKKRLSHVPVAYLREKQEFFELSFKVSPAVLIPRPETELMVEEVIQRKQGQKGKLLDLGTGSGCIALSILSHLKEFQGDLVDISEEALTIAKENAQKLGLTSRVQFYQGSLFAPLPLQTYQVIVSNPPYIDRADFPALQPEVRLFEPEQALFAEENGLKLLKTILQQAPQYLDTSGVLLLEMGQGQWKELLPFAESCDYDRVQVKKDLAGIERMFICEKR